MGAKSKAGSRRFANYPRLNPLGIGRDISAADLIDVVVRVECSFPDTERRALQDATMSEPKPSVYKHMTEGTRIDTIPAN